MNSKLTTFEYDGKALPVEFLETVNVKDGGVCDVYTFVGDTTKDLAVVTLKQGHKTPLQRVVWGGKTVEGFGSGSGTLTVKSTNGEKKVYQFNDGDNAPFVEVAIGEVMQWSADRDLVFYEICHPPYSDGRFENIEE